MKNICFKPLFSFCVVQFFLAASAFGATITWVGGSGDWTNAANWSGGAVPGPSDKAVISAAAAVTVTHSGGTNTIGSVQCGAAFILSGGELSVAGTFAASNAFTITGGTLQNATLNPVNGAAVVVQNGAFDGVTVNGLLDVGNTWYGALLVVTNGLTLNGAALVGNPTNYYYGDISFGGSQTLAGAGTVSFGQSYDYDYYYDEYYFYNALRLSVAGATLTIGPTITVTGQNGVIGYTSTYGGPQNISVANYGTILGAATNGTIGVDAQLFTNFGLTEALNGGSVALIGKWTNAAVLTASGGALALGGDFVWANVGTLNLTNGAVYITGILTNFGAAVNLTNALFGVAGGGTILGGTVITTNGSPFTVERSGTLNGVTLNGVLDVGNAYAYSTLTVTNGLVLNGSALVGNPTNEDYGSIGFAGSQTLGGNGTVLFGDGYYNAYDNYGYNALWLVNNNTTLTIGPGITVAGINGAIGLSPYYGSAAGATVVNEGTILAGATNGTIGLTAQNFVNQGLAEALNGGALVLTESWTNAGMLTESGGTLSLGGGWVWADLGTLNRTNGIVTISGVVTNAGGTLNLTNGQWGLALGGEILGGTVNLNGSQPLIVSGTATLNGVTLNGGLDVGYTVDGVELIATNGLTLNGTALLGNPNSYDYGSIMFAGSQTLGGNGMVVFGEAYYYYYYEYGYDALWLSQAGTALTIGPGITVHGINGAIGYSTAYYGSQNVEVINQGTISSDEPGGVIEVTAAPFLNEGIALATNGGTLILNGQWNNAGTLAGNGGTINLDGSFSASNLGSLGATNGEIEISGIFTNTGSTLNLTNQQWALASGAEILGGTVMASASQPLIVEGDATFNGVTVDGVLDVGFTYDGAELTVTNGLTLNGTALLGNPTNYYYGNIEFAGSQTLGGNGTVVFGSGYYYYYYYDGDGLWLTVGGTTLTIGPNITVRGQNGSIGSDGDDYYAAQNVTVINQGTISDDVPGGAIGINAQPFINDGVVQALADSTISFGASNVLAGGSYKIAIGGPSDYGVMEFATNVNLSTINLSVSLDTGYVPAMGSAFPILTYGSASGLFGSLALPAAGFEWQPVYSTNVFSLVATNQVAPVVNIVSPANGSAFASPGTIQILAQAENNSVPIAKVSFYEQGELIGESTAAPYTFTWNNVPAGSYWLTAVATDARGNVGSSAPVIVSVVPSATGTNFIWTSYSGDWSTAGNWTPAGVPGSADSATITNGGTVTLAQNVAVQSVTLGYGIINGSSVLAVGGAFNWTGGTLSCPAVIQSGAVMNIDNTEIVYLTGALTNAGTLNWAGAANLQIENYGNASGYLGGINNLAGGVFNIYNNQSIYSSSGVYEYLNNAGLINKGPATGVNYINVVVTNTGTINVESGTMALQSAFNGVTGTLNFGLNGPNSCGQLSFSQPAALTNAGTLAATLAGGFVPVSGDDFTLITYPYATGNFTNVALPSSVQWQLVAGSSAFSILAGAAAAPTVTNTWTGAVSSDWSNPANWIPASVPLGIAGQVINFSNGVINLSSPVTVGGQFNWIGGTLEGNALTIGATGILNIDGPATKTLEACLTNYGTVSWNGGNIAVSNCAAAGAALYNGASGVWAISCDQYLSPTCVSGTEEWLNAGTVVKWGLANSTTIGLPFQNIGGLLEADEGNLAFTAPVTLDGASLAGPGTTTFSGGFLNNGILAVNDATVSISAGWTNSGIINATNSVMELGGNFTLADVGALNSIGGTVEITGTLTNTGTTLDLGQGSSWEIAGGTIQGGTITATNSGAMFIEGGSKLTGVTINGAVVVGYGGLTLNGVSIDGSLDAGNTVNGATIYVTNGLVLNGSALVGNMINGSSAGILFEGSQTLGGNGNWLFGSGDNSLAVSGGGTLTIGAGVTMSGKNAYIGEDTYYWNEPALAITNYGTLLCNTNGGTFTIRATPFANLGTVEGLNGGSLYIDSLQNSPEATVWVVGGALTLWGSNGAWTNSGTIDATNAAVLLGGTFWTGGNTLLNLGTFGRAGGSLVLGGLVNNSGQTLVLGGNLAGLVLGNGGDIVGGTVNENGAGALAISGTAAFNGVTFNGILDVGETYDGANLILTNGMTLNGTAFVGNPTNNYFGGIAVAGSQTLGGSGAVVFANDLDYYYDNYNALWVATPGAALTIGPGITVRGANGAIGYSSYYGGPQNVSVVNDGVISADVTNGTIIVWGQPFINQGVAQAINGGTLSLNGQWTNAGTLVESGSTFDLGGSFTWTNLGTFYRTNGLLNISGALTNTGSTLNLTGALYGLTDGGDIIGGTVISSGAQPLIVDGVATLNGVTLNGVLDVGNTYDEAELIITNGLTLNGTALIGNPTNYYFGSMDFAGSQTLAGSGSVIFGDEGEDTEYYQYTYNALWLSWPGTTLTIGPGIAVRGDFGSIGTSDYWYGPQNISVVNEGTIAAGVSGGWIDIAGESPTNLGSLSVSRGAAMSWAGDLNFGLPQYVATQPGGTIQLGGNILGNPNGPAQFNPAGTVEFASGTHELETMSTDLGNVSSGFVNNFTYGGITLESGAQVTLENLTGLQLGGLPPCVYVNSLNISSGATLNLNGLNLYCRLAQISGTVLNGSISQAPSGGGPIATGNTVSAALTNAGAFASWTFYGQAGQHIVVAVDTGSASVPPPVLGYAYVQLFDPYSNLVAQASNTVSGQVAVLNNVTLPASGNYSVQVRAPSTEAGSAGDYQIAVWVETPSLGSLVINQSVNGLIATPYSLDQWNFSASAGQQISFDLINSSGPGVAFSLTGPNAWVGFTNLAASSGLVTLPYSGTYTISADGTGGNYDINFAFELVETAETNTSIGTAFASQLVGSGQAQLIAVTVTNPGPMKISLALNSPGSVVGMYVKYGAPPTPGDYDYSYQGPDSQVEDIIIPEAAAGVWYILVYGNYVPQVTSYTLLATQSSVIFEGYAPNLAGSGVKTVLSLAGAGFNTNLVVELTPTNGSPVVAPTVTVVSPTDVTATFPSNTIPPGTYTVCVSESGTQACLTNVLTVIQGGLPDFHANFTIPSVIGYHEPSTIYVNYANTGTAPMPAPLLLLSGTQSGKPGPIMTLNAGLQSQIGGIESKLLSNFNTAITNEPPGFQSTIQILASGQVPGILQPGESNTVSIYYAGWLEPWDFTRPPLVFTLGIHTAEDDTPIDWADYATNSQPAGVSASQWGNLIAGLEGTFGGTWGSYVSALDQLVGLGAPVDGTAYDASQLFDISFDQITGFGVTGISGIVVDTTVNQPVTNAEVTARQQLGDGQWVVQAAVTDGTGHFNLADIPPGTYQLSVDGYATTAGGQYTLGLATNITGITIDVEPIVPPSPPPAAVVFTNESNPALTLDSAGVPHLVWNRGGFIWHAYYNGTTWVATGAVPGATGGDPQIVAASNLVNGVSAGVLIAWQDLGSSNSTLYYSVATNSNPVANAWSTSLPDLLSDGETNYLDIANQGLALAAETNGQVVAVWQKHRTQITDDTDLYFHLQTVASANLEWPTNEIGSPVSESAAEVGGCVSKSFDLGGFTIPESIPLLGGEYDASAGYQACIGIKDCSGMISLSGNGEVKSPLAGVEGMFSGSVSYVVDPNLCQYQLGPASATYSIAANLKVPAYSWKYGPVTAEIGSLWGIGSMGSFFWPNGDVTSFPPQGSANVSFTVGIYGEAALGIPSVLGIELGSVEAAVKGTSTLTGQYAWSDGKPGVWTGSLALMLSASANYKSILEATWEHTWTLNFPDGTVTSSFAGGSAGSDLTITVSPFVGTTNVYGGLPVLAGVRTNVVQDGTPSLAVAPSGDTLLAWTIDSENPADWLGSKVVVATLHAGAWSAPLEVTNSRGFNTDAKIFIDSLGHPVLVWTMASAAGLGVGSTASQIMAAMASNDVVYSVYENGGWSQPAAIAILPGTEDDLSLGLAANGDLLAAWVNNTYDVTNGQAAEIYASLWNGSTWTTPAPVAAAQVNGPIAIAAVGGASTLFWTQDYVDTNAFDELSLYSSSLNAGSGTWSAPQLFTAGAAFASAAVPPPKTPSVYTAGANALLGLLGNPPESCCLSNMPVTPPPPQTTNCPNCTTNNTTPVNSQDPNGKIGPAGYGAAGWVLGNTTFPYTIDFENSTNATAPAQIVTISDPISTNLDWSTFALSEIAFGSNYISVPPNCQFFTTNVGMTYLGVNLNVQVDAGIDLASGEVYAEFNSVNTADDLAPPVNVGFLPPEDGSGRGKGFVSYFIQPMPGLAQGTQITNVGYIQFDQNPVLATDLIDDENPSLGINTNAECLVTIDNVPPSSHVNPLPPVESSLAFTVSWSGTDDGPGIGGYDIYVSANNGAWTEWLTNTTATSAVFAGSNGQMYRFYSVAIDEIGNAETNAQAAEAETVVDPCGFVVAPASVTIAAKGGTESLTVAEHSDCEWSAATTNSWITIVSGGGGRTNAGTVKYTVAANKSLDYRLGGILIAGETVPVMQLGTNTILPTLTVAAPSANLLWSNAVFAATGTAADKRGISAVWYQLNDGPWTNASTANNWTNWSATLALTPGTNIFGAYALDVSGNATATKTIRFNYVVTNAFRLQIAGKGTVAGATNGQTLFLGRDYHLTATPAAGFVFTNWLVSTNWVGGTKTNKASLQFMMASNLTVMANFVEIAKPTVTITNLKAGEHLSLANFAVRGTASDDWLVTNVWCEISTNGWIPVWTTNSYKNWTATNLVVAAGTNLVKVYAVNEGGLYSATNSVQVVVTNSPAIAGGLERTMVLFTSPSVTITGARMTPAGLSFDIQVTGAASGWVEFSTDLIGWNAVAGFSGTNTIIHFNDPGATNSASRFYRLAQ